MAYISIGASGGGKWFPKAQSEAMCIENRHFPGREDWFKSIAQQCKAEKKYMMVTIDIPFDRAFSTSELAWLDRCQDIKDYLTSNGFNRDNCDVSVINEPMKDVKAISVEFYLHLVNLTCSVFQPAFKVGFGNEEYDLAMRKFDGQGNDFYTAGAKRTNADKMFIHIQSSMRTPEAIEAKCNELKAVADKYGKEIDCNEANYENVADPNGFNVVKYQMKKAKEIGCKHFAIVFLNLDGPGKYEFLTFVWQGKDRTTNKDNPYGSHWKELVHLINIERSIKDKEEDWMALELVKYGSRNEETRAVQQIMMDEGYDLSPYNDDGIYGKITKQAIEKWQTDNSLKVDGIVGPQTWQWLLANIATAPLRFDQLLVRKGFK